MWKQIIKQKTEKLRYMLVGFGVKYLTPSFHKKLGVMSTFGFPTSYNDQISSFPRPSIQLMQQHFNNRPVRGCEIGVQRGLNSESILQQLNVKTIILVDPWDNDIDENSFQFYKIVQSKFKDNEKVWIIKAYSVIASNLIQDETLDFVYIDANHDYSFVLQDIKAWAPKVKEGGVVAGHDIINCNGVLPAVIRYCIENKIFFHVVPPDWYFIKGEY